jgi:ATP-binding cassette subfamily B (MDR/TAP) protein 1
LECEPWVEGVVQSPAPHDLLFWSGGKDSFLALRRLLAEVRAPILLLTTFDSANERVDEQELPLATIRQQARALRLPILLVPLHPHRGYLTALDEALAVARRQLTVGRLVFGDLHQRRVRDWREQHLGTRYAPEGIGMHFPLWKLPYARLLDDLEASGVECRLTAVAAAALRGSVARGARFDRRLIARLPEGIDAFGECGEFHTRVELSSDAAMKRLLP